MIIVTGATGFIGSNLLADLNHEGRTDLLLVDTLAAADKWKNVAKRRFQDLIFPSELGAALETLSNADMVYHLGANSSTTARDGDAALLSNFRASKVLWEWCTRTCTPFIYASSAATYGDGAHGFIDDESDAALDALRPLSLYAWTKHAFDKWAVAQAAARKSPPHWCGIKFFNVFGPNEYHKADMRSLVSKNALLIAAGTTVKLFKSYRTDYADGQQLRDFIYVKDCTRVMRWLAGQPRLNGIFNLGTGRARSFVDLMQAVGKTLQKPVGIEYVDMPDAIRVNYQYYTQADMRKLTRAGLDRPFLSLEESVADYVQHYLMQPDCYR